MKIVFPVVQACIDDGRQVQLPFHHIKAQCYHMHDPNRSRYGTVMKDVWERIKSPWGMLWIEGDIAIEKIHLQELVDDVREFPESVVAVPFRLYPDNNGLKDPAWPFSKKMLGESWQQYKCSEPIPRHPHSFGLGCTYLPYELMEKARTKLDLWDWPSLDWKLSLLAWEHGISTVATATPAVHLHYKI
jgi:hypothetical protein